jgi:hypothetical protein
LATRYGSAVAKRCGEVAQIALALFCKFAQWCHDRRIALFAVGRHDIEAFARVVSA